MLDEPSNHFHRTDAHEASPSATSLPSAKDPTPLVTRPLGQDSRFQRLYKKTIAFLDKEATFYRVHLSAFTLVPLLCAVIFYLSNGRYHISFIDSVFMCYSAMTSTGLSTVNLSTTTAWQQVMLFLLMMVGHISTVSWIMVLIRKRFFRKHCEAVIAQLNAKKRPKRWFPRRSQVQPGDNVDIHSRHFLSSGGVHLQKNKHGRDGRGSAFMRSIGGPMRNVDTRPNVEETNSEEKAQEKTGTMQRTLEVLSQNGSVTSIVYAVGPTPKTTNVDDELKLSVTTPDEYEYAESEPIVASPIQDPGTLPSSPASDLATSEQRHNQHVEFVVSSSITRRPAAADLGQQHRRRADGVPFPNRTMTVLSNDRGVYATSLLTPSGKALPNTTATDSKYRNFGGFPSVFHLANLLARTALPSHTYNTVHSKLQRGLTLPSIQTLDGARTAWLNFDLDVGRNSSFRTDTLTDEQLEELGGTEWWALRWLAWVVPLYYLFVMLFSFLIFGPWLVITERFNPVFEAQPRLVNKAWFSIFQVMAAYTGGGLSLVDLNMVPFQMAWPMIFSLIFAILAGNHAMPVFLRFIIWACSKFVNKKSQSYSALIFLLDHPRRCFLYLFPSHQTWFLLITLLGFSAIEWIAFNVLDRGLEVYESLPLSVRVVSGLFQGIAARASGFSIVPPANFAPALLFLYVIMMYIAVYPIAMSIRSTNVYEERSLGVYKVSLEEEEEPQGLEKIPDRRERIGRYLQWHLRRQTSVDLWWLVCGVFLVAVVERGNIMDEEKKWFDLFRVVFELVSAFAGIGLSLGLPTDNFSFVGAFRPLSKLIVCVIMVRGRHRGLPVAVDRAILLPKDMVTQQSHKESETD